MRGRLLFTGNFAICVAAQQTDRLGPPAIGSVIVRNPK